MICLCNIMKGFKNLLIIMINLQKQCVCIINIIKLIFHLKINSKITNILILFSTQQYFVF